MCCTHAKSWRDHFFKKEYTEGEAEVFHMGIAPYSPFSRINGVIDFAWSYDV